MDRILKNVNNDDCTFLFGDLNSRSYLNDSCYKKDVPCYKKETPCDSNDQLCKVQQFLQDLPFDETYGTYDIDPIKLPPSNENFCNICKNPEASGGSMQCKSYCNPENIDCIKQTIVTLRTADFFICKKKIPKGFEDIAPIKFLPTYKRDPADGKFLLCKKGKGRLPGYADRIMTNKKNLVTNVTYEPLCMTGNDHLPIYGSFSIKP